MGIRQVTSQTQDIKMRLPQESREKFLVEEVKVIQDIIKRMATNSFLVKAWVVSFIGATFVWGTKTNIFMLLPLICFWWVDAYFIRQERLFRKLHNWVVGYRLSHDDRLFNLDTKMFNKDVSCVVRIMFSQSLVFFYFSILVTIFLSAYMKG